MKREVLIADDHSIVRLGLSLILKELGCDSVTEVGSLKELEAQLAQRNYSHLILDLILGDGNSIELLPMINQTYPNLEILLHSMQPKEVYGKLTHKYQVHSYLAKTCNENEIKNHLKSFVFDTGVNLKTTPAPELASLFTKLAVKELQVMHYLLNGCRTKEISNLMKVKMNTISTVKSVIFSKLNITNISQLIQLADVHQISY